jgi:hypothetical protein
MTNFKLANAPVLDTVFPTKEQFTRLAVPLETYIAPPPTTKDRE